MNTVSWKTIIWLSIAIIVVLALTAAVRPSTCNDQQLASACSEHPKVYFFRALAKSLRHG
ncbi:hypothetical protein A1D17_02865 [Pseudomonas fluorescens]|uniref:Uncharacterized protein n=1 Tax=Pseudomonas fluorescens TaxID=294 RepID=A0A161XFD5_PSEFL|nr:hypothetical protein A1D17_02865 [Pseudomonas fluorescens]